MISPVSESGTLGRHIGRPAFNHVMVSRPGLWHDPALERKSKLNLSTETLRPHHHHPPPAKPPTPIIRPARSYTRPCSFSIGH